MIGDAKGISIRRFYLTGQMEELYDLLEFIIQLIQVEAYCIKSRYTYISIHYHYRSLCRNVCNNGLTANR